MRLLLCALLVFTGCQQKQSTEVPIEAGPDSVETTPSDAYEEPQQNYNYKEFFGTYDHESNAKGFTAMLVLRQNGNDIYFTASVSQGSCKGEMEGVVMMAEHSELEYMGFFESDDCRLQFIFNRPEKKVDIKEISLCHLLEPGCSFEGIFVKRSGE
ncbi:MAG TPA: hypothetical protein VFU05_04925 [Cyclobacteriaceae bacterium]|nr:hypothetical protein [Cyclobacteriaceae bacterium]